MCSVQTHKLDMDAKLISACCVMTVVDDGF